MFMPQCVLGPLSSISRPCAAYTSFAASLAQAVAELLPEVSEVTSDIWLVLEQFACRFISHLVLVWTEWFSTYLFLVGIYFCFLL